MSDSRDLPPLILTKLAEQVERTEHLLSFVPPESIEWRPHESARQLGELLGHLLECLAGFCAALYAAYPERLAHFSRLRGLPVNHRCGIDEARARIREYMSCIEEGFALITDDDLGRRIPTVFAAEGEALLTILLGNFEHLVNHKHELFFYLKLLGVSLSTSDLYFPREIHG
ncbi:MAG TPA: DinB family protein [Blastocatellia bacterium]|nr:DinB family protein [Blastocatellia bacterium]